MISDELISRKAVIDRLQKTQNVFLKQSPLEACGISYAREIIASEVEIPTIEKRPQGEWKLADKVNLKFIYKCSECGRRVGVYTDSELANMYPFCHCGAAMRGNNNE